MPNVLVHAAAVADLAAHPEALPAEVARALREDLAYARFGGLLPDLPYFASNSASARDWLLRRTPQRPPHVTLFHNAAPVALGVRLAELVGGASFVGRGPGLAVVAGYFSHLALDRALRPPVYHLAQRLTEPGEDPRGRALRVEWLQAILFMQHRLGHSPLGWDGLPEHLRVLKRRRFPVRGIGRGLHLLVHTACVDVLGPAPADRAVDGWVRGLWLWSRAMASPLALRLASPSSEEVSGLGPRVFGGGELDFEALYQAALERARHHIAHVADYLARGRFDRTAREELLEEVPEGSIA